MKTIHPYQDQTTQSTKEPTKPKFGNYHRPKGLACELDKKTMVCTQILSMQTCLPWTLSSKIMLFQNKKTLTGFHEDKTLLRWQASKLMSFYLRFPSPLPMVLNGDMLNMQNTKPNSDTLISQLYVPKAHVKTVMQVHVSS